MKRPGTIAHARTLEDGSAVNLDAELVDKIVTGGTPAYFLIRERFDSNSRLAVITQPSPDLRQGQTVDVEGIMTTLEDGQRAVISPTVYGYTDSSGNLLYHGPLVKGPWQPVPWQWKVDLTANSAPASRNSMQQTMEMPGGNIGPMYVDSNAIFCQTIADAKANDLGTAVELRCHPVSSGGTGSFVLGEDGTSDTLVVYYTGTVGGTSRVCTVKGSIDTTDGTDRVLDVNTGPNYDEQTTYRGRIHTATFGSLAWAKTWANDHAFVSGDIVGKTVTQSWPDYLYIEDSGHTGIRVEKTAHGFVAGQKVDVIGSIATAQGERYIAATTITQNGTDTDTVKPVTLINKSIGGGDFACVPGLSYGQLGVVGGSGLNNIGLFVKTLGKVTEVDSQWFKIDDGSNVSLKVAYPPFAYALNDYVIVAGVSSCEIDGGSNVQRILRPQPLTCTVNQASGQTDPTNTSPVNFTVAFSEPVTGFTSDDVSLSGTAGGTKTVVITPTDTAGKNYNLAVTGMSAGTVIALITSGKALNSSGLYNYTSTSTDNSVLFDNLAPSAPTGVAMDHVIPTSRKIRGHWNASTDGGSGLKDYLYQFYYFIGTSRQNLTNWTATTDTFATYDLWYDPSITEGKTYYISVKARDNVLNQSSTTTSTGVVCNKVSIGFLYYKCKTGVTSTYDDIRWYVDSYLTKTKSGGDCSGKVIYTKLTAAPTGTYDYDSYDVLFVALPASDFTSAENSALQWFVTRGFNRRLVLVGEYGNTALGVGFSAYNNRLNGLATLLNKTTRFHADESTQNSYPYDQGISYRDCAVRSHYLTDGVGALWDAGPSTFTAFVNPIAALRDGESAYPQQFWVAEEDVPQGCSFIFIHDCSLFYYEYDNLLQYSPKNPVNNAETDYDDVPDRNFKFVENLFTVFPE